MANDGVVHQELNTEGKGKYGFKIIYTDNKTSTARLEGSTIVLSISKLMPEEPQIRAIDSLKNRVPKDTTESAAALVSPPGLNLANALAVDTYSSIYSPLYKFFGDYQ